MSLSSKRVLTVIGFIIFCAFIMFVLSSCGTKQDAKQPVISGSQFVKALNTFSNTAIVNGIDYDATDSRGNAGVITFIIEQNDSLFAFAVENDVVGRLVYCNLNKGDNIR